MNIASGFPKFCELSQLDGDFSRFVVDDTMFIKMIVDTEGENTTEAGSPCVIKEPTLIR